MTGLLALLEEPARALVLPSALKVSNSRVGGGIIAASSAQGLCDAAASVGEVEASQTRGRVEPTSAACLSRLQSLLDCGELDLESREEILAW